MLKHLQLCVICVQKMLQNDFEPKKRAFFEILRSHACRIFGIFSWKNVQPCNRSKNLKIVQSKKLSASFFHE